MAKIRKQQELRQHYQGAQRQKQTQMASDRMSSIQQTRSELELMKKQQEVETLRFRNARHKSKQELLKDVQLSLKYRDTAKQQEEMLDFKEHVQAEVYQTMKQRQKDRDERIRQKNFKRAQRHNYLQIQKNSSLDPDRHLLDKIHLPHEKARKVTFEDKEQSPCQQLEANSRTYKND